MDKNNSNLKKVTSISIVLFIMCLVWALYFKFGNINFTKACAKELSYMTLKQRFLYDIIPFDFGNTHEPGKHLLINILNLIIFIPFGVILPLRENRIKIIPQALFCFVISLCFEILQLFTLIGGFAADDLLMNTLGYFVGLVLYVCIFKKFSNKVNTCIIIIANIIMSIVIIYGILNITPIFDEYMQIIKDYAFK